MSKCCKKPECKKQVDKCQEERLAFYNDPTFWKMLVSLNILILFLRYAYLKEKTKQEEGFSYFMFFFWLELQILFFYLILISIVPFYTTIMNLIVLFFYYLKALFSPRKTNKIMKFLHLPKTDEFFFRLFCLLMLFGLFFLINGLITIYIAVFFHSAFFLLGYTSV
jgi:hypothetical protein